MIAAIDPFLLSLVAIRVGLWLVGAGVALAERRILVSVAFLMGAVNSAIIGWAEAGGHDAHWLAQTAVYLKTPTVALIVAGLWLGTRLYQPDGQWRW